MILHTAIGDFVAHFRYTEEPAIVIPRKIKRQLETEPHWNKPKITVMQRVVTCTIHRGEDCEKDEKDVCKIPLLGKGETYCSLTEPFILVAGRKIAFARAIEKLTREDRTALWNAFKETVRYIVPKPNRARAHYAGR